MLAEKVVKILEVFEEATREASGSNATSAIVILVVNSILCYLESDVSEDDVDVTRMKREMLWSLNSHYYDVETNKFYCLSTILAPCFKLRVFSLSTTATLATRCSLQNINSFSFLGLLLPILILLLQSIHSTQPVKSLKHLVLYCGSLCDNNIGE